MTGFELHPGPAEDITEIWEFIAEDSPLAARRVGEEIQDSVRRLVPLPNQGHVRPDLTSRPLRFQTTRHYNCFPLGKRFGSSISRLCVDL